MLASHPCGRAEVRLTAVAVDVPLQVGDEIGEEPQAEHDSDADGGTKENGYE
jgi:hypothetical protein